MSELDISEIVDNEVAVDTESSEVVVEEVSEEEPEEVPVEEDEEEPEEEPEEAEEEDEEADEEEEEAVEAPAEEEAEAPEEVEEPAEEAPTEEAVAPVEQVVSDIRDILSEEPVASASEAGELTEDLKQRIAELDYLRECCGNWASYGERSLKMIDENFVDKFMKEFIDKWNEKDITINKDCDYLSMLKNLEKLPEILILWLDRKNDFTKDNYFLNINRYEIKKHIKDKSIEEKLLVLEKIYDLLISNKGIINLINNILLLSN